MSKLINQTDYGVPIVDGSGRPTQAFYSLIEQLTHLEILNGEGSPEGEIYARAKVLYFNETGASGDILFIKTTNESENTGWTAIS